MGASIEIKCNQINPTSLEIVLTNTKYSDDYYAALKWCSATAVSLVAKLIWWPLWFPADAIWAAIVLFFFYKLVNLVSFGKYPMIL